MRTLTHPVDVFPSMRVPTHLPLQDGRVGCITCHDVDDTANPGLLREVAGSSADTLCVQCHDTSRGDRSGAHAIATGRAHLMTAERTTRSGSLITRLDDETEACLSCHDGTVASPGAVRTGPPGPMNALRLLGGQHPIGVLQRSRGVGDHLVSPLQLDPAIRLFEGRVGCGSCHSPYAENEALLVMSNERSGLCLACHDF